MMQPSFLDVTTEQFDRTMKTNLYALFWLCKYAVPHMRPGAAVINVASIEGAAPSPKLCDYAMTKVNLKLHLKFELKCQV
jgi:NAD(P)-dependent dehydrogenase (short-subunit alcohol dehydrogenase family)